MRDQLALDLPVAARPVQSGARLSDDRRHRFNLWRRWDDGLLLGWVMLNPSTADASLDDQTITRCCYYARRDGYAGIYVVNLWSLRTPYPTVLWEQLDRYDRTLEEDPGARENDFELAFVARNDRIGAVVAGWGNLPARARPRVEAVRTLFAGEGRQLLCCGVTKSGAPRHPSRLGNNQEITPWPT